MAYFIGQMLYAYLFLQQFMTIDHNSSGAAEDRYLGGGGADIHIFLFSINFFWNRLFLQSVNTNIWISAPTPIINLLLPLQFM